MKKVAIFIAMALALCLFFVACGAVEEFSLEDLNIDAIDRVDIAAGEYEIPYTIEDLNAFIEHLGITISITATDNDDNEYFDII